MWHIWMEWKMPLCKWHTFSMAPSLTYCFIVMLLYIKRKWLLMRNLSQYYPWSSNCLENFSVSMLLMEMSKCWKTLGFPKILIKMKISKHFTRSRQRAALRKLFISPPDKGFPHLWNKNFLTHIYWNIQTFALQVLWECSSWAFRKGAVEMFFLTHTRSIFARKSSDWGRFLAIFQEYIFKNIEWVEVHKMSEVFWAKLYCKISDLFC